MKDLISREALLQQIGEKLNVLRSCNDFKEAWGVKYAMAMIQNAPTVDAVEVVHAKWEICEEPNTFDTYGNPDKYARCNHCGFKWTDLYAVKNYFKGCPNCGARMDGNNAE